MAFKFKDTKKLRKFTNYKDKAGKKEVSEEENTVHFSFHQWEMDF
jgi:hypothetical protein